MRIATIGTKRRARVRTEAKLAAIATLVLSAALAAPSTNAQGSRKDDVVFGPGGHPVAGATVTVCQANATGTPCSPLATVYTDATLTVPAANPFQTDGIGNYHFYAPSGRYVVQISGPGITGTITYRDVILAPDVSSSGSGNNISAFGLTLGGNLSVAGNATINGTLSAGTFSPSSLNIPGNETVGGPRPRVDVTAYGAKGDGATDDTAAIQAAINAACSNPGLGGNPGGGAVTFPPPTGSGYVITQPQSPNDGPIFTIPVGCQGAGNGISIVGGSGNWSQITNGGGLPPMISIKANCGASPGLGPVFVFDHSESVFLENVSFLGCNQAIQVDGRTNTSTWHFKNVNLGIRWVSGQGICSSNPTCSTDNVPLAIYNNILGWYEGGALANGAAYDSTAKGPNILIAEETGASGNGSGLATFNNLHLAAGGAGGAVLMDGRSGTGQVGNLYFRDIFTEAAGSTPFLTAQAEVAVNQTGNLLLERVNAADNNAGTPCISLSGSSWYNDIVIIDSQCSGTSSPAIVVNNGTIIGCFITGNLASGHTAVNASGNAVSGCVTQTINGFDYSSSVTSLASNYLGTNATVSNGFFGNSQSCPIGMVKSGDTNRSLCIDPFFGWGFGPGGTSSSGYDTRFYRNGNQSLAMMIAQADGPTAPSAALAAGGTLTTGTYTISSITNTSGAVEQVFCASGCPVVTGQSVPISGNSNATFNTTVTVTGVLGPQVWTFTTGGTPGNGTGGTMPSSYWYYIESTMVASNCSAANLTGPSKEVNAAPMAGNQTINLSWTAGVGSAAGYCVWRGTSPGAENVYAYVSGQSTTSFSDTGSVAFASGTPSAANQTFPANPQYTWSLTGLGVYTTNPQYNLDVNGAAAVNSLNGVQKAERFAGADAAAKLNACLVAASTTSGVCDARGMTGTLTGSTHITIPASTVLLWGNGELTISDATTNDAVELAGDGASLYGTQPSGPGLVSRPDSGGYIKCGTTGCTTVRNPNAATANIEWNNIENMSLIATGAGSKVIDLTSIGHAHLEDNRIILGSGGGAYGIFGDTSNGNRDSTNTLIKHNEINNQQQNDICLYLAGIFNINQLEINVCYLAAQSTGQGGFVFAKDSNGNYPNNVQLYGNDCEQGGASVSFGVVCYDVRQAQDMTIGPNNRCEKVYSCFKFPSDGSAVGIHAIDPYLSLSNTIQVQPNEPSTSMIAIDNAGHNWLPSMHFGMNDLAGQNLLGNAGLEGWQNSTTLYYWGGVSGTTINQVGSSIYLQGTSAGANPAVDSYTQGAYNVRVGDGATAGLGINSGCIQVDATAEYTLMFRVAAPSATNTFRPGFRFYSDANCTEANRITSVATNARVLAPQNYMGYSSLAGTGPNWQSSNASLTYNNGISCNCNVTGFDWTVGTANSWTPTRNYGITFRLPNAYSSASTIAHSMRVFLLENTAAANNYIFFDDVILSQGPVSPDVQPAPLADSGNGGTVNAYANYNFAGTVSLQANTGFAGTLTHSNTGNRTYTLPDASGTVALQTPLASWGFQHAGAGQAFSANAVKVWGVIVPYPVSYSHIDYNVSTLDSNTSDNYDIGLYGPCAVNTSSCPLVTHIGAQNLTTTGYKQANVSSGTVQPGLYWIAITGNAATAQVSTTSVGEWTACPSTNSSTASTGGALPATIATPNCAAPAWTGSPVVGIGLE
jgi:hypothetical protein